MPLGRWLGERNEIGAVEIVNSNQIEKSLEGLFRRTTATGGFQRIAEPGNPVPKRTLPPECGQILAFENSRSDQFMRD